MQVPHRKTILGVVRRVRLGRLIHLALLGHLLVVGTVMAVIAGALTYYLRGNEVADSVLANVRQASEVIRARTVQLAEERKISLLEAARAVVGEMQPQTLLEPTGRFLSVEICENGGAATTLWKDPQYSRREGEGCAPGGKHSPRLRGNAGHAVVWREGQVYVLTWISVLADPAPAQGTLHTTFLLSEGARADIQRIAIDNALLAAAIVLLTTLAIYPAILLMIRRIGKLTENLLQSNLEMMQVLGSAIAKRDSDTDEHNYRVTLYSVCLAEALNLGRAEMRGLLKGAFLHDVGKIGIPDGILRKPGRLSDEEMKTMRGHVPLGLDIIARSGWLAEAAAVVGCHHERVDGTGYPKGISGEDIPLTARIFAIADVFDALCSVRPYKSAMPPEEALAIMRRESGTHFDPGLLNAFEAIAVDLHGRYAQCSADELRAELTAVLVSAFSDRISRLAGKKTVRLIPRSGDLSARRAAQS